MRNICLKHQLILEPVAAAFMKHIPQPLSSKMMTIFNLMEYN
jgi:hypothetical protein